MSTSTLELRNNGSPAKNPDIKTPLVSLKTSLNEKLLTSGVLRSGFFEGLSL